jgi:demethylmenaquinone methyltransferase/2-methoxy-6-polyprenyl-1,4-benzoquinol methylase
MQNEKQIHQKHEQVRSMFDGIAHRYDLLNHLLSVGIDKRWRHKLIRDLEKRNPTTLLDVATGTADLAIMASKIKGCHITACDISENMLAEGRRKILKRGLEGRIRVYTSPAESLMFQNDTFDAAMVAFGVRNFADLSAGLAEMCRVIRPGGSIHILEFSMPRLPILKQFYKFYFKRILPQAGGMISGHEAAYQYLPDSVLKFPEGDTFKQILSEAGFSQVSSKRLSFGIASLYTGVKPLKTTT